MLTNEKLDERLEKCLAQESTQVILYFVELEQIIAQAKEANKLREQLATARRDALEEAANVHVDIALITDSDYYYRGFNDCQEKFRKAIRALKEKA